MITNVCLLLEALSVVFCLHCLYGEKFKLDIATTSFLAIDMILMTAINYYNLPEASSMIIYPIIAVYCGMKYGFKLKVLLINLVLCVILVGGIQIIVLIPMYYILSIFHFSLMQLLIVNTLTFLIELFILPKCGLERLTNYLQSKEDLLIISSIICLSITAFCIVAYKEFKLLELNQTILLFACIVFILVLNGQLNRYKVKSTEIEAELKIHKLYADSFQSLISTIRLKQHEFENHISTVYSQHYMYDTYEDLVNAQKNYCEQILKENRFNKLLTKGNPVIISFLYGKLIEIDKKGINVTYTVSIDDMDIGVPIYKIVEILGNLIKNAVEAIEKTENANEIFILMIENKDKGILDIEIRNESPYIDPNHISTFFAKGYSEKGEGRGLGLYNVQNICQEYKLTIYPENKEINGKHWLSFRISNKLPDKHN